MSFPTRISGFRWGDIIRKTEANAQVALNRHGGGLVKFRDRAAAAIIDKLFPQGHGEGLQSYHELRGPREVDRQMGLQTDQDQRPSLGVIPIETEGFGPDRAHSQQRTSSDSDA